MQTTIKKVSIIQAWNDLRKINFTSRYSYPGANLPKNYLKESLALKKLLPKNCCGIFLDYGCGEGPVFATIKQYYKKYPSFLIGIDPDRFRLMRAKKIFIRNGSRGIFLNTSFENPIFYQQKLSSSISCILCIQVLGHISDQQLLHTIKLFRLLLKKGGILILAVPVVNNNFYFSGWTKGRDAFYLVDLSKNKTDFDFRKICSSAEFSKAINNLQLNILPTRSFYIDQAIKKGKINNLTKIKKCSLGKILNKHGFIMREAIIYRVKADKGLGDLMISLQKEF